MKAPRIVVVGAGGFAREVRWLIEELNREETHPVYDFVGYVVSDVSRLGEHDDKEHVLGDYEWLQSNRDAVDCMAIGVGTPGARIRISEDLGQLVPDMAWPALVHPSVQLDKKSCTIGDGVLICAGVIGTVSVVVEPFAMVNLACTLGHEATIGRGSVLNPTVNISGGVDVGKQVLIGTGAQVLQYVRIGEGATVGAGAVVTKDVLPRETVVGVPARPLRK